MSRRDSPTTPYLYPVTRRGTSSCCRAVICPKLPPIVRAFASFHAPNHHTSGLEAPLYSLLTMPLRRNHSPESARFVRCGQSRQSPDLPLPHPHIPLLSNGNERRIRRLSAFFPRTCLLDPLWGFFPPPVLSLLPRTFGFSPSASFSTACALFCCVAKLSSLGITHLFCASLHS